MANGINTTWRISEEIVRKFNHLATDGETNVTVLVIGAMTEYLERHKK
ncbi:MAG TPA: hypothetical protein VH796_09255 [Nitrososphaeraceae archaeon]